MVSGITQEPSIFFELSRITANKGNVVPIKVTQIDGSNSKPVGKPVVDVNGIVDAKKGLSVFSELSLGY